MRKLFLGFISGVFGAVLLFVSGCSTSLYEAPENWAIVDCDTPAFFAQYDLIFLYPTQEAESERGYMNWVSGHVGDEVRRYVRLVISAQFGPKVRVFSPYIPLLSFKDYGEIMNEYKRDPHNLDFHKTKLRMPIDYMVDALEVYFSYYNTDGHPFVIYGQGQGGLVLYEAMKRCGKVHPKNGFVAGYFFGVPGVTKDEISYEFGSRGIKPARKRDDGVGVIAICNTVPEGEPLDKTLALPGGEVINPLNWRTDATPAGKEQNPGSLFFNHQESNPQKKITIEYNFCGAKVDPEHGIIILTGIPKNTKYKIGEWHFPSDAWGIFSQSVSRNAQERVNMYRFSRKGLNLPE